MTSAVGDGIAIVGYSYRMPGGIRSDDDFWRLLSEREIIQEPVTDRYGRGAQPIGGFSGPERLASPYEGLIRDGDEWLFDNKLFGISHNETMYLDPMARMLLSCAYETLERSGWDLNSLHNSSVGVYLGEQASATSNWRQMDGVSEYTVANVSLSMLANRISYQFNLTGPSLALCTACSAGLTALHGAMKGLQSGDCDLALVGSSTYLGSHRLSSGFNALGVISSDGKCHSFDADANGYMRSEGTFIFALKPLAAAERDGDAIHAVIAATAINAAGSVDGGVGLAPGRMITAPTRHGQMEVMRRAKACAGLKAADFDYIEAHGTGTVVGDPIEANAISETFREGRSVPLRLSSVKSNVGHMEAAAFHCSLLKVILMMQRRTFAPISRTFLVPNEEIDFASCPMAVQTVCEPFPEDRRVTVGINSFGFGGANGHCVVQEYRPAQRCSWSIPLAPKAGTMIPLSAHSPKDLARSVEELRTTLQTQPLDLYTLAGNLSRRRTHYNVRTAFAAHHRQDLIEALGAFDEDAIRTAAEGTRRVALVFAGQGTQWEGCGRQLYEADPVFRRVVDAIDGYWQEHADWSLREVCCSSPQPDLNEVGLAQPVVFMIQCALVEMLKTWGVYADYVVGHSAGEVAAAYACGALSLSEATRLVHRRATLQQRMAGSGRMLAVGLDRSGVEALLDELNIPFRANGACAPRVEIACENAPASMVVCGKEAELQPVMAALEQRKLKSVLLPGNIAFHSSAMDPLEGDVASEVAFLDTIPFQAHIPFISSVTGEATSRLDSAYWWSNIRQPVRFRLAMGTLLHDYRPDVVLELAPHSALRSAIAQCIQDNASDAVYVPSLMRGEDTGLAFHQTLGQLYKAGVQLDFAAQYPRPEPITHRLPGYPKHEQKVLDKLRDEEFFHQGKQFAHGPLVGHRISANHPLFESRISEADFPWLVEHRVHHEAIMPAAGYIELILQALEGVPCYFEEMEFLAPCAIAKVPVRLLTALHPVDNTQDEYTFTVTSYPLVEKTNGELHCRGRVRVSEGSNPPPAIPQRIEDLPTPQPESIRVIDGADFYEQLEAILGETFQYGPFFRKIEDITIDFARHSFHFDVAIDDELWSSSRNEGYVLFPVLMDGALQVPLFLLMKSPDLFAVPHKAQSVTFVQPPTSQRLRGHVALDPSGAFADLNERGQLKTSGMGKPQCSISLYDSATGELVLHIHQYYSFLSNPRWGDSPRSKHAVAWQPKWPPHGHALLERLPEGEVEPGALITALEQPVAGQGYGCHVVELAGQRPASQTLLASCIDHLSKADSQVEFWLLSDDDELTNAHYEAFHQRKIALRFDTFAPTGEAPTGKVPTGEAPDGPLRPWSAEIVLLQREAVSGEQVEVDWHSIGRLAVPGGLVLVAHGEGDAIAPPGEGWTVVRSAGRSTLLQLPNPVLDGAALAQDQAGALSGARWVLGEPHSLASAWVKRLDGPGIHCVPAEVFQTSNFNTLDRWPHAMEAKAIDVFCGADPDDPTGEACTTRLIAFTQALTSLQREAGNPPCRVTIVTRRAVLDVENPRGQALWGLVRTMAMEAGEEFGIDFRLVDVGDADDLNTLVWLARHDLHERELAVRQQSLWVPRITSIRKHCATVKADEDPPYRLQMDNPGSISGLQMKTCPLPPLEDHAVEIAVEAAALNFRDVMVTLRLLPALAYERSALGHEVGMEASGTVLRTGSQVSHCKVGDKVAFTAGGSIANRLVVHENMVFVKPEGLTMNEAAASLSVYVTAFYALRHLARLRRGQRVLIHSAMGGVGQAAIALAKSVGAEIYATAGSAAKREQLLALGVKAAFDSHSFHWVDDLLTATGGEGVDVILNSLAGRHIALCLQALRPGGWHCEIGKVDIYADNELHLGIFRKNLRFAAIDVDRLMLDDPELAREMCLSCLDLLAKGVVSPVPATVFPYSQYATALRMMVNGQHQGKLVLKAPSGGGVGTLAVADTRPFLDPDATYLVTGGLGGLGLSLIPYLAGAGARHITLMDRDPQRSRTAEWLRQFSALYYMDAEVDLDIVYGDVAVEEHVQRCVAALKKPLKGVFHLAGVLEDRLLDNMTPQAVAKVFAPKAHGALHLHRATLDLDLDHFVLFSSTSSSFGNPGQANYSAANGFMDGLATYRRQQGLPALAYNMAAIADAGMASRNLAVLRMMRSAGTPPVSADFAIANLDYAMRAMGNQDHLITALFPRPRWGLDNADYLRIGRLIHNLDAYTKDGSGELLMDSVMNQIAAKVAELCGHEDTDINEPLSSFGLNSIAVSELGVFIQAQFNYRASALELMTTATAASLAHDIVHGKMEEAADVEDSESSNTAGENSDNHHQAVVRTPSAFASDLAEHFSPETRASGEALHMLDAGNVGLNADTTQGAVMARGVPDLKGKLPLPCHNDLSLLRQFIQSRLTPGTLAPPTPPEHFKAVLLTGATGFIGCHVLRDLLQQQKGLVVHCLVRAKDHDAGHQRLRAAMEDVGIWDEALVPRIRIVLGNTELHQFGLPQAEFNELSQQIDAVYHLAANLALVKSYTKIRKLNTFSLRVVLDLCLHTRMKHLFFTSTMGVFPQYFTLYGKEFSDSSITCQMQPDLDDMKRVFPLGIAGYPWSKLVAEQAFLFAHAAGLPGAIFRLPQVYASSNGHSQASAIVARVSQAVLDVRIKPKGLQMQIDHEPVDMVSSILSAISLNPDRQFTVYHVCNSRQTGVVVDYEDFGFDVREESYDVFKRACLARGERSPLYGYWTLMDHFAPYWLNTQDSNPLVSEEAIRTDCTEAIHWPGSLLTFSRSFDWIVANRQRWPYPVTKARLDEQHLLDLAERCCEEEGVPLDQAVPEWMRNGMGQLLKALNRPEAQLLESRVPLVALDRSLSIRKNVALARDWLHYPQIDEEVIETPVFIVGINRTGTTYLHRLMSRDPRFWTLRFYELAKPVLDSGDYATIAGTAEDPRREIARDIIETMNSQLAATQLENIHDLQGDEPEEDFLILNHGFMSWVYTALFHVPEYAKWLSATDLRDAYAFHRRVMKHFTWQRRQRVSERPHGTRQWLFKMPFHLMELDALLETYPDAVFIQTHREPAQFMGSWNSLVTSLRSMTSAPTSADAQGAEQLAFMSNMLNQATAFRLANPQLQDRWIDVQYEDLITSPFATLEHIYARFGWTLSPATRAVMERWQQEQAQERARRRQTQAPHRYALDDYGLSRKKVDAAFAPYLDFVSSINWG